MADPVTLGILATTAALATAGSTVYQIDQANSAKSEANAAAEKQQMAVDKGIEDQKNSQKDLATNQARILSDRRRQASLKSSINGRNGTLLTTPYQADSLGAPSAGTTLLGA